MRFSAAVDENRSRSTSLLCASNAGGTARNTDELPVARIKTSSADMTVVFPWPMIICCTQDVCVLALPWNSNAHKRGT
jgi:hypothetical protein